VIAGFRVVLGRLDAGEGDGGWVWDGFVVKLYGVGFGIDL